MSGTRSGGLAAAATNKLRHGDSFYADIGAKGGALGRTGGFASPKACNCPTISGPHKKASCAGKKGGQASKRRKQDVHN